MCMLDDVDVEHASNASACNVYIRKIMARELVFYGTCESKVVYAKIADEYNKYVRDEMVKSGLECTEWTTEMVQRHFEHHTKLVPRHVIGRDINRLELASQMIETEMTSRFAEGANAMGEMIDGKCVTKLCNVIKAKMMLVRELRGCVKEDVHATGVAQLWKSMDLGSTGAAEAKKLLDQAALVTGASGHGDRPAASDLFSV